MAYRREQSVGKDRTKYKTVGADNYLPACGKSVHPVMLWVHEHKLRVSEHIRLVMKTIQYDAGEGMDRSTDVLCSVEIDRGTDVLCSARHL